MEVSVPPPKRTGKRGVGPAPDEPEKLSSRARQAELPGFEDKHLEDLEQAAVDYAAVRDQRQALTKKEVDLKGVLLNLMKRYKKTTYNVEEMTISIVVTQEKIKVRIKKEEEPEED